MLKDIALEQLFPTGVRREKNIFITGTDTEIGKTTVSKQLLHYFNRRHFSTVAAKPVASGSMATPEGYRNDDALQLQQFASIKLAYPDVNPFAFLEPIAPHLAAKNQGVDLTVQKIYKQCQKFLNIPADIHLIEGVGGWLVPLNDTEMMHDLVATLSCEIILVVGIRVGCINHALLTVQSILGSGLPFLGWIANYCYSDTLCTNEVIATLQQRIPAPLLAELPNANYFTPLF